MVNSLDPLGKAFFAQVWQNGQPQSARHYAVGYRRGKSRIEAIVQQHVVGYRLRQHKCSSNKCFFDVANALYSPYHDCIDVAMSTLCMMRTLDSHVLQTFDWWNDRSPQIPVKDPITRHVVDVSLSTYEDDVSKTIMCKDAADLETQVDVLNFNFDASLERAGMAQNKEKQEHAPCFCGPGDQTLPGSCKRSAKYLGGQQHHLDTCEDEIKQRERAARAGWATFGRSWSRSSLPKQAICLIFSGMVVAALVSGIEALTLSAAQIRRLDSIILTYGRKLMRGRACRKEVQMDGSIKYVACTSTQVWKYLRLVPCEIELRVRRLLWLQSLVRQPELHANLLAALFGMFPQDPDELPSFSTQTNPWAQQLLADVLGQVGLRCLDGSKHGR